MSASAYQRNVRQYLREAYGVDASLRHLANHDRLEFEYPPGTARNLTLHRSPRKIKNTNQLVAIKKQDIRRLLGAPPRSVQQKEETTMPQPAPIHSNTDISMSSTKSIVVMGRVAHYKGGRIKFHVPAEVASALSGCGLLVTRDGDGWEIRKRPGYKTPAVHEFKPGSYTIEAGNSEHSSSGLGGDYEPFAPTPAEYLLEGGVVLVRLAKPAPVAPAVRLKQDVTKLDKSSNLHQTLKMIANIERTTPYRLTKNIGGHWMFKAPTVFLK